MNPTDQRLQEQLQALRLHRIREQYQPFGIHAAKENWTHIDYLARLLES